MPQPKTSAVLAATSVLALALGVTTTATARDVQAMHANAPANVVTSSQLKTSAQLKTSSNQQKTGAEGADNLTANTGQVTSAVTYKQSTQQKASVKSEGANDLTAAQGAVKAEGAHDLTATTAAGH